MGEDRGCSRVWRIIGGRCVVPIISAAMTVPAMASAQAPLVATHVPPIVRSLKPLSRLPATTSLDLMLGVTLQNAASLDPTILKLYDTADPSFHKFLIPAEFQSTFGPTAADLERVENYARAQGFTVLDTPGGLFVHVRAPVTKVEASLKTKLQLFAHPTESRQFFAPTLEPVIPASVPITHITGLDSYIRSRPMGNPCKGAATFTKPPTGIWGKQFRTLYAPDVTATGKGQTIGIFTSDGYYQSDIEGYEDAAGIAHVKIVPLISNQTPSADNCEVSMDIENALSMAPGVAQITVYESDGFSTGTLGQLSEMAAPTKGEPLPGQLSTSYSLYYDQNMYVALKRFAAQGQAFFAASGDVSAFTPWQAFNHNTPFPPADFPWITSVGGTTVTPDGDGQWQSETAWHGSGGGWSPWVADPEFNIPSYQLNVPNASNRASPLERSLPDVALVATNVVVRSENGIWSRTGGTSSSSPLWAGFSALINEVMQTRYHQQAGFLNPVIYKVGQSADYAAAFHDITTGNNSTTTDPELYAAVTGYDLVTGWGTPHGQATIDAITKALYIPHTVPSYCAGLPKVIMNLQAQLANAQAKLGTSLCSGPASLLCVKNVQAISNQLSAEENLEKNCS